jgi:glycosyltransferase involved in cell wall biosynthesis
MKNNLGISGLMYLSIVVPCFNEEETIAIFYNEIIRIVKELPSYELIFIDDGSHDNSLAIIREIAAKDLNVKYVSFSRNFGKEAAIYAGLEQCTGEYVCLIDVDLQDPPSLINEMLKYIEEEEYDCVGTRRVDRKGEPPIRSFFAKMFYKIMRKVSDMDIVDGARDYRIMKRKMAKSLLKLNEYNRFSKGLFTWVGFKTKWIEYQNIERTKGESSWSFWSLFKYSIEGILSFTILPLYLSTIIGIIISLIAFITIIIIIIRTILFGNETSGWTSLISVILFMGGIQLIAIGILGQYLSKTYTETKKRPHYIERESNIKN